MIVLTAPAPHHESILYALDNRVGWALDEFGESRIQLAFVVSFARKLATCR